ncbi:MAG: ompW [Pedosphaera sp.]|nr:ompW [Pedosphaera sp.]
MKLIIKRCLLSIIPLLGLQAAPTLAADNSSSVSFSDQSLSYEDNFQSGRYEIAVGGGALFSPIGTPKNRPKLNYALGLAQFGLMLTSPPEDGFFRGNFEFAPEVFAASIYEGPGKYIAGGTIWLRYNFIPHHSRLIPFLQIGGGFVVTDIDHRYDGQDFNFNLAAATGLRFFVCPHSTVNLEYRFQHISNANLGNRNLGINAHGPILSVSYLF